MNTLVVLLEAATAHVLAGDTVQALPFSAASPDALVQALQLQWPRTRRVVLVIGGAFLDVARPELPALAPDRQRRALHFQADRLFALRGPCALALVGPIGVAADAAQLRAWSQAVAAWVPVAAVVSLPQAVARLAGARDAAGGVDGEWQAPAAAGEHMAFTLAGGAVREIRRVRGESSVRALDARAVLQAVAAERTWPATAQLLDLQGEAELDAAVRRSWWRAAATAAALLVALLWAVEVANTRRLDATRALAADLERQAAPALAAQARLQRANDEARLLRAEQEAGPDAQPAALLARLGALLPRDAWVQRLEWDGEQWRIDGSAEDAAALIPLLESDARIEQVTTLAPSTRFVDGDRQRSSFAIGFRVAGAAGDTRATQGVDMRGTRERR